MGDAGQCNEGFRRDDALLVIVLITDEEDDHETVPLFGAFGSAGEPPDWFNFVTVAKNNIPGNLVQIGRPHV